LIESPIDWGQFKIGRIQDIRLKTKKELRKHQIDAINSTLDGFNDADRGKLIMACGTGKTFTALRLVEQYTAKNSRILFLAPSISLVAQTLREWTAEGEAPIHAFVVCSDTKVGKDEEDIRLHDLAYPATTDAKKIAFVSSILDKEHRTVVFSTYQSIQVVADAQKLGLGDFDLIRDPSISKEDIFFYVYGVLHSPEYKQRFASDLKKMLPRIPFAQDFRVFCNAGRELSRWHLSYETVEPFPLSEESKRLVMEDGDYRVSKMTFGKKDGKPDKTVITYNAHLTLRDIPLEAYEYVVNGKSAIEWIMERYQITVDKSSGIKNNPNDWCAEHGNPRYIVDLIKRIVRVSVESSAIVKGLPPLQEAQA